MINQETSSKTPKRNWQNQLISALQDRGFAFNLHQEADTKILNLSAYKLYIQLIDLNQKLLPEDLIFIQDKYVKEGKKLIHLWEDVWMKRPDQVLFRIKSLLGLNIRIHGRKTKVEKINKPIADTFLNSYHLQGAVNSRYKFALFYESQLIAVATFSALRKMRHSENYTSIELIRFAVKGDYSVTGGLSKLIKYVKNTLNPNDLMTYADRDWSAGEAYLKLGFEEVEIKAPQYFGLDEESNRNLCQSDDFLVVDQVFNTGSLKFILRF